MLLEDQNALAQSTKNGIKHCMNNCNITSQNNMKPHKNVTGMIVIEKLLFTNAHICAIKTHLGIVLYYIGSVIIHSGRMTHHVEITYNDNYIPALKSNQYASLGFKIVTSV